MTGYYCIIHYFGPLLTQKFINNTMFRSRESLIILEDGIKLKTVRWREPRSAKLATPMIKMIKRKFIYYFVLIKFIQCVSVSRFSIEVYLHLLKLNYVTDIIITLQKTSIIIEKLFAVNTGVCACVWYVSGDLRSMTWTRFRILHNWKKYNVCFK